MTRKITWLSCLFLILSFVSMATAQDEIRIFSRLVSAPEDNVQNWQILVMIRPQTELKATAPEIRVSQPFKVVSIQPEKADLSPERFTLFYVTVSGQAVSPVGSLDVSLPKHQESKTSGFASINLAKQPWQMIYAGKDSELGKINGIPSKDAAWQTISLPKMWEDNGVTWLQTEVFVPKNLEGLPLYLTVSGIDDNDITFFNGKEIGRTNGWNRLREYPVPKEWIRFDEVNEIVIAAEDIRAGGGIRVEPIMLGHNNTRLFPQPDIQKEADRQAPRPQGKPLPLRPMQVRDGVLEYIDGGEVALWGVNYYPQSFLEFLLFKEQNIDVKTAINADLDDLVRDTDGPNRINAIRIHVVDTEISDAEGNLIWNEHLDMLDYLVSKCNERGIHLWLTPIAWWGGTQPRRDDAFSLQTPIQALFYSSETWAFQQRYLKQFLEHENPYTKRRLVDEPCLNLFEIINEPLYWSYGELTKLSKTNGGVNVKKENENTDADPNVAYRKKIRKEWNATLPGPEWESADTWDYFQYTQIRHYIETMYQTIRATGAKQPIAFSAWLNHNVSHHAIADSPCETITMSLYPGGLSQTPQADARNLLTSTSDAGWSSVLAKKARLVYEFDASDTYRQIDLYPAMARFFRNKGAQVACQFQYDSRFHAAHNRAWPTHYLNAVHAPERFVSFLIAGETFRTLPRGTQLNPANPDERIFPPTAVSYSKNAALLCKEQLFMQARPTDWHPIPQPEKPTRIIAVGSTPYFDYEGTGIVDVRIKGDTAEVQVNPDVKRLQFDVLRGTPEKPLTQLEQGKHSFRLKLPGWGKTMELESGKTYNLKK
ncbi:hypothetical protein FACS1894199_03320 [Bacteroidia bacterium]|nr:hypothetical protein FACS1894199_03320 [Bacteroidia bacterium]